MRVSLIFDIGKTNKKCFLFNEDFQIVYKDSRQFEEIKDDQFFPCEDLVAIQQWIKGCFEKLLRNKKWVIESINFSAYGASFVHIDKNGKPLTPLYNYLKPYPEQLLQSFYKKYGDPLTISQETASPNLGMLNSGLQLFWLKNTQPKLFQKIQWSLHLPQYLSYLFTGQPISDYTSIGCHTSLWNYLKGDYHDWVYAERINKILPPIITSNTTRNRIFEGYDIKIGTGIHDSTAALIPYIRTEKDPFLLISTGTWSIALNPFNTDHLTKEELQSDCLNYMDINGNKVKAARLFLGNEYEKQLNHLSTYFNKNDNYHYTVKFDTGLYTELIKRNKHVFKFDCNPFDRVQPAETLLEQFQSFEEAYHQLMIELIELQILSAERAIGNTNISKIFIDGGFTSNAFYIKLLSANYRKYQLLTADAAYGSALGATMVISNRPVAKDFLNKTYGLKKHDPFIIAN